MSRGAAVTVDGDCLNELATAGRFTLTIQVAGANRTCHFNQPVVTGFNLERVHTPPLQVSWASVDSATATGA